MAQEIEQLRELVGDLFSRVERLEERVGELEDNAVSQPKGPEPILTCVQCLADYKESENAEGYCKYHNGTIKYGFSTQLNCCGKSAKTSADLLQHPGCIKGKHRSKHHADFFYTNYLIFMRSLSNNAKEMWLEMDIFDYTAESCMWAEVGKTGEGDIFVLGGPTFSPSVCASLKPKDIKKFKKPSVLFEKSDSVGWCLKAEVVFAGSEMEGILVTLKTAWSKVPYVKKVIFSSDGGDDIAFGSVETLSDPRPQKPLSVNYTVPEGSHTGPVLEPGEDYSQGRKTDYPTVTNDDLFAMEMVQLGGIEVYYHSWRMPDGEWLNMFTTTIKVTNGSLDIISITDVLGEYQNKDGEWVGCEKVYVKHQDDKDFMKLNDFLVDGAAPTTLVVRLDIKITGRCPGDNQEGQRADHSLPQPLLLRVTLVDSQKRTASLIVEQGNKPLPLATMETRQASWSKKKPLLFYLCADDVDLYKRSDVALYYNEDLCLVYRPSPNNSGNTYYTLRDKTFQEAAYKAKKSGEKEQELTSLRSENKGSKIEVFATVDLEYQHTFALKVVITTPTSSATGYFLLPQVDDIYQSTILTTPEVEVKADMAVEWKVPYASKNDKIAILSRLGTDTVSSQYNRKEETEGSLKMKAPGTPGVYEVRYYPSKLNRSNTVFQHSIYVASAQFAVITA